jgi:hypothetical protein
MKVIVIDIDHIKQQRINTQIKRINFLPITENNEIFLLNQYNTYKFISSYFLNDENLEATFNNKVKELFKEEITYKEPFLTKKEYIKDYPLPNDNTLYIDYYFVIKINSCSFGSSFSLNKIINILEDSEYNNPHESQKQIELINILKISDLLSNNN